MEIVKFTEVGEITSHKAQKVEIALNLEQFLFFDAGNPIVESINAKKGGKYVIKLACDEADIYITVTAK